MDVNNVENDTASIHYILLYYYIILILINIIIIIIIIIIFRFNRMLINIAGHYIIVIILLLPCVRSAYHDLYIYLNDFFLCRIRRLPVSEQLM